MEEKQPSRSLFKRPYYAVWACHPRWKKKLIAQTIILWVLLAAHAGFLGWSRREDTGLSSFFGFYGFEVLTVATDCSLLREQQSAWALAVNILATLITYVSSDVLLALSAPSRSQLDVSHVARKYMEVGVHSFHNIRSRNFDSKKRVLWVLLSLLVLPFHLIYNSVIIVSQPASESYQISVPNAVIPVAPERAAVSQSVYDPAATEPPAAVSAAATALPSMIGVSNINNGAANTNTAATTTEPSSSPSACVGPTGGEVTIQTDAPQAPIQPQVDSNCDEFAIAPCGMGCQEFASDADINIVDFLHWNPGVTVASDDDCEGFYGGFAYCVGVSSSSSRRRSFAPFDRRADSTTPSVDDTELADSIEVLEPWSTFQDYKSVYATSPFIAWSGNSSVDSLNPSDWAGLSNARSDLDEFLALAYYPDSARKWSSLSVNSSDWDILDLDVCRESFSELYRPSTGTVILLLSGVQTTQSVIGLSYLSYNQSDLVVTCPTEFLQSTPLGSKLIEEENPPVLPLMFGTFETKVALQQHAELGFQTLSSVCPDSYSLLASYAPTASSPQVEGCALKIRNSECRIGVNIPFTVILLVALTIKALCMTAALFVLREEPILTVGDAIAEYLDKPDPNLANCSLSWTEDLGWTVVDGAIITYQHGRGHGSGEPTTERRIKDGFSMWLVTWPGRQWRKVWGYSDMGRDEPVPKCDVLNNFHTMRSSDSVVWLWFYTCTLAVCFGIFYSINSQDGWIVTPAAANDLYWMLWPTILCNLPQLFATMRAFVDTWILTTRSSLEEFASYARDRKGLRVSEPKKDTAQTPAYFFGGMNAIVFMTTTGLQTLYAWIISEYAQPQWINPLRPSDPADYFSPAFLMKIGSDSNRTLAGKIAFCLLIALFPFLAVHLVNMVQSLVVRVRTLRISELSTFIPQYLADVLLLRWVAGFGRPEETAHLLPKVPLQMPGPATCSLVIAMACHPKTDERDAEMSKKPVKWGVVRCPRRSPGTPTLVADEKAAHAASTSDSRRHENDPHSSPTPAGTSQKPTQSSHVVTEEELIMSPTMHGAPHLSGDEAAFAAGWFDLTGVPANEREQQRIPEHVRVHPAAAVARSVPEDEEKGLAATETQLTTTHTSDDSDEGWEPGHCSFSAENVFELEPGRMYTGIRRGEGELGWRGQVMQLLYRLRRGGQEAVHRHDEHDTTVQRVATMSVQHGHGVVFS